MFSRFLIGTSILTEVTENIHVRFRISLEVNKINADADLVKGPSFFNGTDLRHQHLSGIHKPREDNIVFLRYISGFLPGLRQYENGIIIKLMRLIHSP